MCKGEEVALVHLREKSRKGRGEITLELVDLTGEEPINPILIQPGHAPYCSTPAACCCEPLTVQDDSILVVMGATNEVDLEEWGSFHYEWDAEQSVQDPNPVLSARLMPA